MRNLLLVLCIGLFQMGCSSTIYVVRHAEKLDESADPELSAIGQKRAEELAAMLQNKNIQHLFTTKYKRTQLTAKPLSRQINNPIQTYNNLDSLCQQLLKARKNTLVVGHSNTVLPVLIKLGVTPSMKEIGGNDYDNLFVVHLKGKKAILEETTYGVKTP